MAALAGGLAVVEFAAVVGDEERRMGLFRHQALEVIAQFGLQFVGAVHREGGFVTRQFTAQLGQLRGAVFAHLVQGVLDHLLDQLHGLLHGAAANLEIELGELQQVTLGVLDLRLFQADVRRDDEDALVAAGGQGQLLVEDHAGGEFQAPLLVLDLGRVHRVVQGVGDRRHQYRQQLAEVTVEQKGL
ncbi:hypothetical protein D3C78_1295670 [compost metagenome]